jgi:hypothetical protein
VEGHEEKFSFRRVVVSIIDTQSLIEELSNRKLDDDHAVEGIRNERHMVINLTRVSHQTYIHKHLIVLKCLQFYRCCFFKNSRLSVFYNNHAQARLR